jgi:hypothetical protein
VGALKSPLAGFLVAGKLSLNRAVAKAANTHSKVAALARSTLKLATTRMENMSNAASKHILIGNYAEELL